ncbi:MAG: PAS domain-containing protein [Cytophagales bacterium]
MEIIGSIFSSEGFMPRCMCGNWSDELGWFYIGSNTAIWGAYFSIPILLMKLTVRGSKKVFIRIFVCFILFIFLCGTTNMRDALIFSVPIYKFNAFLLFFTAIISWATVFILYRFLPTALQYNSPSGLQYIIDGQIRKLSEAYQKLAESEKQFKTLVNGNPDIITRIGKDLTCKFINNTVGKFRNIETSDIIEKTILQMDKEGGSKNNELFVQKLEKAFDANEAQSFEFFSNTNGSKMSHFSMSIIPLENENGEKPEDVLTITKDITAQKMYEIELSNNVANLEIIAKRLEKKHKILEDFTYLVSHNLRSPVSNLSSLIDLLKEENTEEFKKFVFEKIIIAFDTLSATVSDLSEVVQIRQNTDIPKEILGFD